MGRGASFEFYLTHHFFGYIKEATGKYKEIFEKNPIFEEKTVLYSSITKETGGKNTPMKSAQKFKACPSLSSQHSILKLITHLVVYTFSLYLAHISTPKETSHFEVSHI